MYNDGDLVAAKVDENGTIKIGKYYAVSKTKVIIVDKKQVSIIGKVLSYKANVQ